MLRRVTPSAIMVFLALVAGCSENPLCTSSLNAGLVIEVRDATTGQPAAESTFGTAEAADGFVDTLDIGSPLNLLGAWERPGVYSVNLRKEGYEPWAVDNIVLAEGTCHVATVHLQADLIPE